MSDAKLIDEFVRSAGDIRRELAKAIVGQERVIEELLIGLFARGHCLLVGVPGLAKTLLVSSLAQILDLKFQRIQFTPDLMPSDITGTDVLQEDMGTRQRAFQFAPGPIFANLILADEINRTPPKTQAALLQAMQEHQVTVLGRTYPLPDPFFVLATQNPIEQEGTYPLPEAQLDRFLFQINIDYPSEQEERDILQHTTGPLQGKLSTVLSGEKIAVFQDLVRRVPVAPSVVEKALRLVRRTRPHSSDSDAGTRDSLSWGAGPRAGQALLLGAKVRCLLKGRFTVSWEDVAALAGPVLRHRLILSFRGEADGVRTDDLVRRLIEEVG
ncbi:MAG: MoxR family ATPase [Elusimicrobia bacterium]|nr:MoxR family ATPase [Elusimicrobiota bacterium]